jgi:chromosome partitioning protein
MPTEKGKKWPKIITTCNHKGGCAKTTTTVIMAQILALQGQNSLVLDTDAQGNASEILLPARIPVTDYVTLETCLQDMGKTPLCLAESWLKQISVLPCCTRLEEPFPTRPPEKGNPTGVLPFTEGNLQPVFNVQNIPLSYRVPLSAVRDLLANVPNIEGYDTVLIDTPPSLCPLTQAAVAAADLVVIPCTLIKHSVEGVPKMIALIKDVWKSMDLPAPPIAVLATIHDQRFREEKVWLQSLMSMSHVVGIVPRISRLSTNIAMHKSIFYKLEESEKQALREPILSTLRILDTGTLPDMPSMLSNPSKTSAPRKRAIRK